MLNYISHREYLREELDSIESRTLQFLDASEIEYLNHPGIVAQSHWWKKTDDAQKILQIKIKDVYFVWREYFFLLFKNSPNSIQNQIDKTDKYVIELIEQKQSWNVPATIAEAKEKFSEKIKNFYELLDLKQGDDVHKWVIIPDTNSLIQAPDFSKYLGLISSNPCSILILPTVLKELDELKDKSRDIDFREKVKSVIRRIKGLRVQGKLSDGVVVDKIITVRTIATEPNFQNTLKWLDWTNKDDRIIASVLEIQRSYPNAIVLLVTSDINLQNKAEVAKIPTCEPPKEIKIPGVKKNLTLFGKVKSILRNFTF